VLPWRTRINHRYFLLRNTLMLLPVLTLHATPPTEEEQFLSRCIDQLTEAFHAAFPEVRRAQELETTLSPATRRWRAHKEKLAASFTMGLSPPKQLWVWSFFFANKPQWRDTAPAHPSVLHALLRHHLQRPASFSNARMAEWIDHLYTRWLEAFYYLCSNPRVCADTLLCNFFIGRMPDIGTETLWELPSVKTTYDDVATVHDCLLAACGETRAAFPKSTLSPQ
jgi:hypothetical protein